ncbi:uncharacterized protein LOC118271234 [Spodoptera frugiperda]|uniref:Uncharacterized protein LOC118271234 n=1 Tax=Spodoptera frugiperda TaxID=7108 RepID=A0A9R0D7C9_SPOFR|nr:uncharacterized protein LOC118271234 [Spodoptera frugiperda]
MTMLKFVLVLTVCVPFVISTLPGLMLGPGRWLVLNMVHCDNPEQYDVLFDISRKKINRTHDCFDLDIKLDRVFNHSYALLIDVYQKVDGGFKYYQTISDDSACAFLMRQAEENVRKLLTLANIDPPDCPLRAGLISIKNYVFDYRELPRMGVYGTYEANAYFLFKGIRIGCAKVVLNFDQRNGEGDDDDDDDDDDDGLF